MFSLKGGSLGFPFHKARLLFQIKQNLTSTLLAECGSQSSAFGLPTTLKVPSAFTYESSSHTYVPFKNPSVRSIIHFEFDRHKWLTFVGI